MCYSPQVSITTAIIEFFVASYIWLTIKHNKLTKTLVIFLVFLGMYQFSEFMICTTSQQNLWGRIGVFSYNMLPALGLHFVLLLTKKKANTLLYLPTAIFAAVILFHPQFISEVACETVFVTLKTLFFRNIGSQALTYIYWLYYFGYIIVSLLILSHAYYHQKSKSEKSVYLYTFLATIISIGAALMLIVILPSYGVQFPSIYCEFSLLFALMALIGVRKSKYFKRK